jgi:CRP-like cAMP-binding protein
VYSIVSIVTEADTVEVATVGNEGMVGLPVFLSGPSPSDAAVCQMPGDLLRIRAARFRDEVHRSRAFQIVMLRYTQAFIHQIAQHAACYRLHSIVQRCASRLLAIHERVNLDEVVLTQESLAQMLGVRRATVTAAAGTLQRAGSIR